MKAIAGQRLRAEATEQAFVQAFVVPPMQERWLLKLGGKGRQAHLQRLHHHWDFQADQELTVTYQPARPLALLHSLIELGAPSQGYLISADSGEDASTVLLADVLAFPSRPLLRSSILICRPRQLVVVSDEFSSRVLIKR